MKHGDVSAAKHKLVYIGVCIVVRECAHDLKYPDGGGGESDIAL